MSQNLRVLVADDERPAREKLRRFLEDSPSVSAIFEVRNGAKAVEVVRAEHPDVVFLDIGMPGLDGVTAAESIVGHGGPYIVFVTAYDEHAIRAFELGAADYLLKPFDRERFDAALERVEAAIATEQAAGDVRAVMETMKRFSGGLESVERIKVEDDDRSRLIRVSDVIRFDADGNYVRVVAKHGEYSMRGTMNDLERRLSRKTFARINRSQIVNLDCVFDFSPVGHGDQDMRMVDGTTVRVSRRYRDRIEGLH